MRGYRFILFVWLSLMGDILTQGKLLLGYFYQISCYLNNKLFLFWFQTLGQVYDLLTFCPAYDCVSQTQL
jgi:uncharacterized membrane protein